MATCAGADSLPTARSIVRSSSGDWPSHPGQIHRPRRSMRATAAHVRASASRLLSKTGPPRRASTSDRAVRCARIAEPETGTRGQPSDSMKVAERRVRSHERRDDIRIAMELPARQSQPSQRSACEHAMPLNVVAAELGRQRLEREKPLSQALTVGHDLRTPRLASLASHFDLAQVRIQPILLRAHSGLFAGEPDGALRLGAGRASSQEHDQREERHHSRLSRESRSVMAGAGGPGHPCSTRAGPRRGRSPRARGPTRRSRRRAAPLRCRALRPSPDP